MLDSRRHGFVDPDQQEAVITIEQDALSFSRKSGDVFYFAKGCRLSTA
jgi:hypothetical protein